MRIGIDIKAFKNGTTGIARYLRSILDCLQGLDQENEYILYECTPSCYVPTNPRWRKRLIPWRLPGVLWQQFVLPFHLQTDSIDVFWAPEQVCPLLFTRDIPIVTTVHDLAYVHFPETFQFTTRQILARTAPSVLRKSTFLVAVSDYIRRDIQKVYGRAGPSQRIVVIPNGHPGWSVSADYSAEARESFLLFPGNLEPRKNVRRLLEALSILKASGKRVELKLTGGKGWRNSGLLSDLHNGDLRDQVSILGHQSEMELQGLYSNCRALIYPSLYEGFGLPVLEALSLDCLPLTSRNTVMEEIAGDAALYFDPYDPRSISSAISRIFEADFDRSKYLQHRATVLQEYSWKHTANQHLNLFVKAAGPN